MKELLFSLLGINRYAEPKEGDFKAGQRVQASYHNAFSYPTPFYATILGKDKKRRPHHFAGLGKQGVFGDGLCDWYWVRSERDGSKRLFPEPCLEDDKEGKEKMRQYLENTKDMAGQPGFEQSGIDKLKEMYEI